MRILLEIISLLLALPTILMILALISFRFGCLPLYLFVGVFAGLLDWITRPIQRWIALVAIISSLVTAPAFSATQPVVLLWNSVAGANGYNVYAGQCNVRITGNPVGNVTTTTVQVDPAAYAIISVTATTSSGKESSPSNCIAAGAQSAVPPAWLSVWVPFGNVARPGPITNIKVQ